jgi:hypothetical protein
MSQAFFFNFNQQLIVNNDLSSCGDSTLPNAAKLAPAVLSNGGMASSGGHS